MTTPDVCNAADDCASSPSNLNVLGNNDVKIIDRMEQMQIQTGRRSSRRQRQNSHKGGGVLMFFEPPSSSGSVKEDEKGTDKLKDLSRREQRRIRLEQMRRSRTSSISSVGSGTIPTLDEEQTCSTPDDESKEETIRAEQTTDDPKS